MYSRGAKPDLNEMPRQFIKKDVPALKSSFLPGCKSVVTESHQCFTIGDCKARECKGNRKAHAVGS